MDRIPAVRLYAQDGTVLAREGVGICFYMRRSHEEIARAVTLALETYLKAVGTQALGWYVDNEGDWQELDDAGWTSIWYELGESGGLIARLTETPGGAGQYGFEYYGKSLQAPLFVNNENAVCAATFWLPSAHLEKHGPSGVRQLALQLASVLPFNSGHAGLAINTLLQIQGVSAQPQQWGSRYPGIHFQNLEDTSWHLGTRVRGVSWMNFLGPPVLGELGGVEGLRSRLSSPGTRVEPLDAERAVVTLGEWPEAGDTEQGLTLPSYRELARVLEPWLYHSPRSRDVLASEQTHRWERRFLD